MRELDAVFEESSKAVMSNLKSAMTVKKKWAYIAGDVLYKQLHVSFIKKDTLVLECSNPCWVNEIKFYEDELLKKVNSCFKEKQKIKIIKVSHGKKSNRFA